MSDRKWSGGAGDGVDGRSARAGDGEPARAGDGEPARDRETFEAFAARFARVEAVVPDRPGVVAREGGPRHWAGIAGLLASAVVVALVAVVGGGQLLVGGGRVAASGPATTGDPGAIASPSEAASEPAGGTSPSNGPDPFPAVLIEIDPVGPVETLPPPCTSTFGTDDRARTSPAQDAARATSVVIARVGRVGAAQWNTPDGRPKARDPNGPKVANGPLDVMRFVHFDVESTIHGPAMPALVTAWVVGGKIGCNDYGVSWLPSLDVDAEYVVFLTDRPPANGTVGVLAADEIWAIRDGSVTTPFSGTLTVDELIAAIQADPTSSARP